MLLFLEVDHQAIEQVGEQLLFSGAEAGERLGVDGTAADMAELAGLVGSGALQAPPVTVVELATMDDAYAAAAAGTLRGKVVITP